MPIHPGYRFLRRIRIQFKGTPGVILYYEPASRNLRVWFWPVTEDGRRVTPSDLSAHRTSHNFSLPSCLCAVATGNYTESAITIAETGRFFGEYVVGCAAEVCGYRIPFERMYSERGLFLRRYPTKAADIVPQLTVTAHVNRVSGQHMSPLSNELSGVRHILPLIPTLDGGRTSTNNELAKLTSVGLTAEAVVKLFAECCGCKRFFTREALSEHVCTSNAATFIDLTLDSDG